MNLTLEQLVFLARHDIPLWKVYDATGLPRWLYREIMSEQRLIIAYGVSPCARAGHTLRTRAGSCVQCDTRQIAYMKRWDDSAEVYVAYSLATGYCKVGSSVSAESRVMQLNNLGYAGADDWELHDIVACDRAGYVESTVHQMLGEGRCEVGYRRDGVWVNCKEVFSCHPDHALEALTAVLATL